MAVFRTAEPVAVLHPETGQYVVAQAGVPYDENDPLVKAHPWMFVTAEQLAETNAPERPVESATRAPGERRSTRKQ